MEKIDSLKPALKSSSKESHDIASKVKNIEGKIRMPIRNVTFVQPLNDVTSNKSKPIGDIAKRSVRISEMHNQEAVEGARITLPMAAVEEVSARFKNTLYGFFIGDRLAFPLVENYVKNTWAKFGLKRVMLDDEFFLFQFETKDGMEKVMEGGPWLIRRIPLFLNVWTPNTTLMKEEIKCAPVWIKLRHVPIVAYSEVGLSLITTQIGRPIMLDTYTSNMCLRSWGRKEYARALVEVLAEEELMDSMVIAIPHNDGKGHSLATITIEYEWRPPRCATCKVFDHTDNKCPKITKVGVTSNVDSEGFVEVKKKKQKPKQPRHVEGVRLSKPKPNFYYRRVEKGETSQSGQNTNKEEVKGVNKTSNGRNSVNTNNETNEKWKHANHSINESDSEEAEEIIMEEHQASWNIRGLNFSPKQSEVCQMIYDYKLSMCAILESHAKDSNLVKICSSVFKHWDWTSN
ncbi:zinc knuckle CX2CX4HX4C containing protein [Tanacetum coccineum]|uniref:Zinc knuckle CX2CX4HX4C containing protein n=1 Tax=Tanacetum coccineum TaxID=301880 RepID=A0ABQ5DN52_9ASTR